MNTTIPSQEKTPIYVLGEGSSLAHLIADGSAIAMEPREDGFVLWYEGDIYKSGMAFEEKAKHAGGRMFERYPTIAKHFVNGADLSAVKLVQVGELARHKYQYTPLVTPAARPSFK